MMETIRLLWMITAFCAPLLSYDGGGYWHRCLTVEVVNPSDHPLEGEFVEVIVGTDIPLTDEGIKAIRICDRDGRELLYDIRSAEGEPRRKGRLQNGDRLIFPVWVPAGGEARYLIYAHNPRAWPVPDFIKSGLINGGFEAGRDDPSEWIRVGEDESHHLYWTDETSHSGKRCVKCVVNPGAQPTWVKFYQRDIPLRPGVRYRFKGWVKAKNVKGKAGWYIHVFGDREWLINRVFSAGEGSYGWRPIEWQFTAPEGARIAHIGTVLYGTGAAWFDDAELEPVDRSPLKARFVGEKSIELRSIKGERKWAQGRWRWRVPIIVHNFEDKPLGNALFVADLRKVIWRFSRLKDKLGMFLIDTANHEICPHMRLGDMLIFRANLAPKSEKRIDLYLSESEESFSRMSYKELISSPANLVKNPSFEKGEGLPEMWRGDPGGRRVSGGRIGNYAAMIEIPEGAKGRWLGWRQEIPARPNTLYFYAGFVKVEEGSSPVRLHGHWHDKDHKWTKNSPTFSTDPQVSPGEGWRFTSSLIHSPSETAFVELHLTSNAPGRILHDGIFFGEIKRAITGDLESRSEMKVSSDLMAWPVNPLIKIFPDTPPEPAPERIDVWAARNEYETIQIGLRSKKALDEVEVKVSEVKNKEGGKLPDPEPWLVGYVKVDRPSAYYSTDLPPQFRFIPKGEGGSDGWTGEWPDPLMPMKPFRLSPNRTVPVVIVIHVPEGAKPGDYEGSVRIEAEGVKPIEIPIVVHVWRFALPRQNSLKVIFDLRNGPGWNVMPDAESLRRWYRFLAEYRISPGWIRPEPVFRYERGHVSIDTERFDEMARLCLDELKMNVFYLPFFYAFGWAYKPKPLFGLEPFSDEYEKAFGEAYKGFADHLKDHGWFSKAIYYISDEPHYRHDYVIDQMKRLCDMAHRFEPDLPIYSSTWAFVPQWEGYLDIWGVGPHGSCPVDRMRHLRKKGFKMWFTTDGHMCIDTPYLAIERLLPWLCFKYDVSGYEFWGVSWWTYDPWERGWHRYIRQSAEGKKWRWVRYPNGDGYLAYPGRKVGLKGPVPSIRILAVRDGVEDYELFNALSRYAEAGDEEARRVLDRIRSLVQIPNRGGRYSTHLMPDPDAVQSARIKAGEILSRLTGGGR